MRFDLPEKNIHICQMSDIFIAQIECVFIQICGAFVFAGTVGVAVMASRGIWRAIQRRVGMIRISAGETGCMTRIWHWLEERSVRYSRTLWGWTATPNTFEGWRSKTH